MAKKRAEKSRQKKSTSETPRARLAFIFIVFFGLFSLLFVKSFKLQVIGDKRVEELADRQFLRWGLSRGKRGSILDRHGEELAVSSKVHSLFLDPKLVKDPWGYAKRLSGPLDMHWKRIYKKIRSAQKRGGRFIWVKRHLDQKTTAKIKKLNLEHVYFQREYKRFYPHSGLASHILGFTDIDGKGLEGLERQFDIFLKGRVKRVTFSRDGRGRKLISSDRVDSQNDNHLVLTLDRVLQYEAEKQLKAAIEKHEAKAGSVLLLDSESGEILALANWPNYDLENPAAVSADKRRNRAITDLYEPGSTLKPLTVAAALEENEVGLNELIDIEKGVLQIGRNKVRDTHLIEAEKNPFMNWVAVLALSSNVGVTKIGFRLGPDKFRDWLSRFGFGEKTRVELTGERSSNLPSIERLKRPITLSNTSFGQGLSVTPLQLVTAYTALANNGKLVRPTIFKEVRNGQGAVLKSHRVEQSEIISEKTAQDITRALLHVVEGEGTGGNAKIVGFQVAGKTGTSQKVLEGQRGYADDKYIASFIGYLPTAEKKLLSLVVIDEPSEPYYGNVVAAPVFQKLMKTAVFRYRMKKPDSQLEPLKQLRVSSPEALTESIDEEKEADGMLSKVAEKIEKFIPSSVQSAPIRENKPTVTTSNSAKRLSTTQGSDADIFVRPHRVKRLPRLRRSDSHGIQIPNLRGLLVRDVFTVMSKEDLKLKIDGSGVSVSQDPLPGTWVKPGSEISYTSNPRKVPIRCQATWRDAVHPGKSPGTS